MNKLMITCMALSMALWGGSAVMAASTDTQGNCQYTVLQNLIRDARSHERIFDLIRGGVPMEDPSITCGGTLLQLAIRRGNPSIVNGILTQDKSRANMDVPLKDFSIPGAPAKIPVILFAAYYAPTEVLFNVFIDAGSDISVRDENGRDVLWYLDQNPVLRRTAIEDKVRQKLQNQLLENARKNAQRQMGEKKPLDLKEVKDNTPQQLMAPSVSDSTLVTPSAGR